MKSKAILTIDSTEPFTLFDLLRQQKAAQTAADRTAKKVRTSMTRAIRARMRGLLSRDIRDRITLRAARIDPVRVTFEVNREPLPLGKFRTTQLKRAGVKAYLPRGPKTFRDAFKARMESGHKGVYRRDKRAKTAKGRDKNERLRRGRLPLREMYGPSIDDVFGDEWQQHGLAVFQEHFDEELFRALRFARGRRR